MALINCDFFSDSLGFATSMTVILPQKTQRQIGMAGVAEKEKFPVLYLLHGCSDDHTIWLRRTSIERYVASLGIAVVMPNVHRSFYTNMAYGYKYWDFVSQELPQVAHSFFPLSEKREDNFVAGLSMGGYGAFKLALRQPERFAAAASLSGVTDIAALGTRWDSGEFKLIFGDNLEIAGTDNDLYKLVDDHVKNGTDMPKLYQICGTEDFLYEDNLNFKKHVQDLGLDYKYDEAPGEHNWDFWDCWIQKVLAWLPIR